MGKILIGYKLGMTDIEILLYTWLLWQIIITIIVHFTAVIEYIKYIMNCHLNDKLMGILLKFQKYFCVVIVAAV